MKNSILMRARPEIINLKTYQSARLNTLNDTDSIFLDANECPFEPYIGANKLSRYPEKQPKKLSDILCKLYDISSQNLMITRGADEAIECIIKTFCIPYKDNIIICPPTFSMYEHSAKIHGIEIRKANLKKNFSLDKNLILENSDENTKIIFICSPNNPTGNLIKIEDILSIIKLFSDKSLIVIDETYIEYSNRAKTLLPLIEKNENLVVIRSLSKSFALAGNRCGVAITQRTVKELLIKTLAPYPIPSSVVDEVCKTFDEKNLKRIHSYRSDIKFRKRKFIRKIKDIPFIKKIYPSETNFVLLKIKNSENFIKKCKKNKILIRDQSNQPNLENCVRISIGSDIEMDLLASVFKNKYVPTKKNQRVSILNRKTNETSISVKINLDQRLPVTINTGIGFYDHMLEQVSKHGGFSTELECIGDLNVDAHHTIEDCAIALGKAMKKALGKKLGIERYGFTLPMDESLVNTSIDLSGRFFLNFSANFPEKKVGEFPTEMVQHFFYSFAENLGATIHISVKGVNTHHMVESCFKSLGKVLQKAIKIEGETLPSTKGIL